MTGLSFPNIAIMLNPAISICGKRQVLLRKSIISFLTFKIQAIAEHIVLTADVVLVFAESEPTDSFHSPALHRILLTTCSLML